MRSYENVGAKRWKSTISGIKKGARDGERGGKKQCARIMKEEKLSLPFKKGLRNNAHIYIHIHTEPYSNCQYMGIYETTSNKSWVIFWK